MIFDTVIIGGGSSGLACGIRLQEAGKKCVIISSGQSALHFSSGSFDLLNTLPDGTKVTNPIEALKELKTQSPQHPYTKIGEEKFAHLAQEAQRLLAEAKIHTIGSYHTNHYRLTPFAIAKPTWLTMADYVNAEQLDHFPWKNISIINFTAYLDFHPNFFADKFRRMGMCVRKIEIDLATIANNKNNLSEMRSTNIARLFDSEKAFANFANILKSKIEKNDAVLLPACLGLERTDVVDKLSDILGITVKLLPTFPPSVSGIRAQYLLKQRFMELGGTYMLGDTVNKVEFEDNRVTKIYTVNHNDIPLRGEQYVLCSGSFFSQGLVALPNDIIDPICGLDIDYISDRKQWFADNTFDKQNYESFGIKTDERFLAIKDKKAISNLHVCGASLGGFNALKEGCGGGVSLLTALYAAEEILGNKE